MDKKELKNNILEVQLDWFINENKRLQAENEKLLAIINLQSEKGLQMIEMIDKTLSETHGYGAGGEPCS